MNKECEQQTANFFFPSDAPVAKCRLTANRKLVPKHDKQPISLGISIPSTTDTKQKSTSKPSSAGMPEQLTPPQIIGGRKRIDLHTKSDERKPNNYRIFSSNINSRSSYPNETKMESFGFQNNNEFLQQQPQPKQGTSGILSPSKQLNQLPEIFHRVQKNSSQGFRLHSGNSRRGTIHNFNNQEKAEIERKCIEQLQMKLAIPKQQQQCFRDTQIKLPNLAQQGVPFLQTKQQKKIINRIFSGKRDI